MAKFSSRSVFCQFLAILSGAAPLSLCHHHNVEGSHTASVTFGDIPSILSNSVKTTVIRLGIIFFWKIDVSKAIRVMKNMVSKMDDEETEDE